MMESETVNHRACPECGHRFSLLQGLKAWNPWRYRCPYCQTVLETTGPYKLATLAAIPLGLVIAVTAILQEEAGVWRTADSLLFFLANKEQSSHGRPK